MMLAVKSLARYVLSVLFVLTLVGCTDDPAPDPGASTTPAPTCPAGSVPVDVSVPDRDQIRLNVVNATGVPWRAISVVLALGGRGFQMLGVADSTSGEAVPEAVVVRHGPATSGAAWLVALQFGGVVRTEFDRGRADDTIDVILGAAFENVLTPTEVNQAVAAAPSPTPPPGGCAQSG